MFQTFRTEFKSFPNIPSPFHQEIHRQFAIHQYPPASKCQEQDGYPFTRCLQGHSDHSSIHNKQNTVKGMGVVGGGGPLSQQLFS